MPEDYGLWSKRAPMLYAMKFEELIERGLVMIGSADTVARQIIEHQRRLDLFALAGVFKFGGMPHDMVVESMRRFACEAMPRVRAAARHAGQEQAQPAA